MERDLGPLPRWSVESVYPGLASAEYEAALAEFDRWLGEHERALEADGVGGVPTLASASRSLAGAPPAPAPADDAALARVLDGYVGRLNRLAARHQTLDAYTYAFFSTDTRDETAKRRRSELEMLEARLDGAGARFLAWIGGALEGRLDRVLEAGSDGLRAHRFFLEESLEQARHLMSEAEEVLASALAPAGGNAWRKLHQTVTSQIEVPVEVEPGRVERLPMSKVRNLAHDPDPEVRRRAYEAELAAWEQWKEPCAAALNGVKGWAATLNKRRRYGAAIEPSLEQARIDRGTLDALTGAMRDALPDFRRYLLAKARRLGKARLAWHDLFAPVSPSQRVWRWDEARAFIERCFGSYSPQLEAYARRAFDERWIDAEPRAGKVGGAFCMPIAEARESRILANFDGTFDQVSTLAHELGHGYHNEVLKDLDALEPLRSRTPMTLAETASIFCETICFQQALSEADPAEKLAILETSLIGSTQVVVDIWSRYLFETRVFERRDRAELAPGELCALMREAQIEAYGEALDAERLHPYMWAVKIHYYSPDLGFYNYPYAFGLLFGLGLYAIYRKKGGAFCADYDGLLGSTGLGKAAPLAARFGIDIRDRGFWDGALDEVRRQIEEYEAIR